jgi:hypothetical protein
LVLKGLDRINIGPSFAQEETAYYKK